MELNYIYIICLKTKTNSNVLSPSTITFYLQNYLYLIFIYENLCIVAEFIYSIKIYIYGNIYF